MVQPKKVARSPLVITRTMVWVLLVAYGLFLVGQSTYQNYRVTQDIALQKKHITELQQMNHTLELSLLYYRSTAFKEVAARQWLGLKGKEEHVVALPFAATEPQLAIAITAAAPATDSAAGQSGALPPYKNWWNLLFGPKS